MVPCPYNPGSPDGVLSPPSQQRPHGDGRLQCTYGNDLHHLNSILQPATATNAPVVGIAITTETTVPGCATGASHMTDLDEAARFMLEVAKSFGRRSLKLYDEEEFEKLQSLYGSMNHFQKLNPFS